MRLIDADAFVESIKGVEVIWYLDGNYETYDDTTIMDIIEEQPTVEAVPMVHLDVEKSEILDTLDKMQFFLGQRAGRELWNDKPEDIQEKDLENFNRDIEKIKEYLFNVKPVVHGKWVNEYINRYGHPCHCCSVCGFHASYQDKNFCPECGADMRKKV